MSAFVADLSRSPSHPFSTPGMVQSVRPISHTLNTVTFLHKHALSLPPLPLFTVYSCCLPSELPPTLSFTLNIQHSLPPTLPPLLASSSSYIHLPLVVHRFFSIFTLSSLVPSVHLSPPVSSHFPPCFSLSFSLFLALCPAALLLI